MTQASVGRLSDDVPLPDRLLAVATRLFAERGFEGTSVQEIVNAAGVTKGAMYHYFGSKDDLLYEIYHRLLGLQMRRLEQIADGPGSAEERLRAAALDVLETSFLYLDDFTVFFRSTHLLPRDRREAVRAERRRYQERFRDLVEEGQRARCQDRSPPAVVAAGHLIEPMRLRVGLGLVGHGAIVP